MNLSRKTVFGRTRRRTSRVLANCWSMRKTQGLDSRRLIQKPSQAV